MRKTLIASALTILAIIAIPGMAVAQAQTKFMDNSPAGSPVSLAGIRDAKMGQCNVTVRNNDSRPAVAVVVDFDGVDNAAVHMAHDHFFKSDEHVAVHGMEFNMQFPYGDATKTVSMITRFVQFNDGLVWEGSDSKAVKEIAVQRRVAIDYLNEVLAAPDVKAKLTDKARATKDDNGNLITARLDERAILSLASDPIATAKDRLANADAHSAWLNSLVK